MGQQPDGLARWHQVVRERDPDLIDDLLAPEVTFRSPAVHTPVTGVPAVHEYLEAALAVLGPSLEYQHEWSDASSAVLEFTALIGGDVRVHGIDMIRWDDEGRIADFTVMVRPFKTINTLIGLMGVQLKAQAQRPRQDSNLRPRD